MKDFPVAVLHGFSSSSQLLWNPGIHQNPVFCFGPKPGEIQKKPAKKYISLQGGGE
jgi:hypothetical protein